MINQITKKIMIGEATDVTVENLSRVCFDCVLNVHHEDFKNEKRFCKEHEVMYVWSPVPRLNSHDIPGDLVKAADKLEILCRHYKRILVHCEAGIDRAPFVVAKYFCNVIDLTLPQAYDIIRQQRKIIMEHYEWNK